MCLKMGFLIYTCLYVDCRIQQCMPVEMLLYVSWRQSCGGEDDTPARLASSAGDPAHHLPPRCPIFYSASPSSGLLIGRCPKKCNFIKVSVRGRLGKIKAFKDWI